MLTGLQEKQFQSTGGASMTTSMFAISVIGLCVWAECLKCLLPAISWLPSPHDSTHCLMSEMCRWRGAAGLCRLFFFSLPGRLCSPYLRTRAAASCRWLAFLCLSLIPTACAVKRWRRIAHQIRILKRPEFDFMWQRDKKRCVWVCALGLTALESLQAWQRLIFPNSGCFLVGFFCAGDSLMTLFSL